MLFSPSLYGPLVESFLSGGQGPDALQRIPDGITLFPDARFPEEALAGLWLWFDNLDRSHRISQHLQSREAAFWHGIMHRREPDPVNAAYWFRRVGKHPVFPLLHEAAAVEAAYIQEGPEWDPVTWIEDWEAARRQPGTAPHRTALAVQRIEWELLFHHCAAPVPCR